MKNINTIESILKSILKLQCELRDIADYDIIDWASPVPWFGDIQNSRVATLGLNPSNLEFKNSRGEELKTIDERRFHTLRSLELGSWSELSADQILLLVKSYNQYFSFNPYDIWFKKLDYLFAGTGMSYYFPSFKICHLDIVPFATNNKWGGLKPSIRNKLIGRCKNYLPHLLNLVSIETMVLNGRSVINHLLDISHANYIENERQEWNLLRKKGNDIKGVSFEGIISRIGDIKLNKELRILGFNHNIQSSYGVNSVVINEIKSWLSTKLNNV